MPQTYPLMRLYRASNLQKRIPSKRKPPFLRVISYQIQKANLDNTFAELKRTAEAWEKDVAVEKDPRAVIPERALVFELIGSVEKFEKAAASLGFEWLCSERVASGTDANWGQQEEDDSGSLIDNDDSLDEDESDDLSSSANLYLTVPSKQGLKSLTEHWKKYTTGNAAVTEAEKTWWALFGYLKDIRPWSPKDRIEPVVADYINYVLEHHPDQPVTVELDLWFRATNAERVAALSILKDLLATEQAEVLDTVLIEEIKYHAVLVKVPAAIARTLAERHGSLANADGVMTIRAQSVVAPLPELKPSTDSLSDLPVPGDKPCIGAILDGYPIAAHELLNGRLIVLEKDVEAVAVPVDARFHGTAMASLVLHGDLNAPGVPQARKLAVVPVLAKVGNKESIPTDKLPVGIIYRAIMALIAGTENGEIEPEQIVVINHSICNRHAPFSGRASPWAALLDYFAYKHNMLFVISAGNIEEGMPIRSDHADVEEFLEEESLVRTVAVMQAAQKSRHFRNLLTPAESVNGLTVGALHVDHAGTVPEPHYDPYPEHEMAALYSAAGPGINRSIKPDLVEAGGRSIGNLYDGSDGPTISARGIVHVGQKTAVPDPKTGAANQMGLSFGTSNAAALVTRTALQIADVVEPVYEQDDEIWIARRSRAVILKALIAHSCRWGDVAAVLNTVFTPVGTRKRSKRGAAIASFLGYGRPDPARVGSGSDNRITLLADDEIAHDKLHEYRIPVPKAILTSRDVRRIIITLAWSSPVSVDYADYRAMSLALVNKDGKSEIWKKVKRTNETLYQPDSYAIARGTLTHVILEGSSRTTFDDKDGLFIGVQARAPRKEFQRGVTVPYALAVTIELATNAKSTVYEEVSEAIRQRGRSRQQDKAKVRT